jgi:hypothetical protein
VERSLLIAAIDEYLAAHPESLIEEISRGVRARRMSIVEVLHSESRFVSVERRAYPSDRARVWLLASSAGDTTGRPLQSKQESQEKRLLAILRDGMWHSSAELYQKVPSVVHSRINVLRKRDGHDIRSRRAEHGNGAEAHSYRLVVPVKSSRVRASLEETTVGRTSVVSSSDERLKDAA